VRSRSAPSTRRPPSRAGYVFDTADPADKHRLEAQTGVWDPFTCGKLAEVGVAEGWRCLEVGGGTGSVARWLAERVGDTGRVVVTDVETRWLDDLADAPNVEVRRHDVTVDPLEEATYDLVHARLVLMHLPERDAVLATLAAAVRPGGWLVIDDSDLLSFGASQPHDATWAKVADAAREIFTSAGADVYYGRKLPGALRSLGLDDVSAEGRVVMLEPPESGRVIGAGIRRMRPAIVERGLATAAEVDQALAALNDPDSDLSIYLQILMSIRGRRACGTSPG
jgi:SAM-dependent methyltransferase